MKKGFTLIEVNLAILIMATGVLVMCGLYSLGFRESRQSAEDVVAVSFAETYLGPLVQGLSATNMTWSQWKQIGDTPSGAETAKIAQGVSPAGGWKDYIQVQSDGSFRVNGSPRSKADGVWNEIMNQVPSPYKGSMPSLSTDYDYALVATRQGSVIQLAFRAARRRNTLMSQPLFVSEVRFQGDPDK